ncbi:MAG: hypothetical protein F6K22_30180 [Okeania sp. SIO2F4]|uniref:hypothetical protein n=1 Tax=Okeania sp. SIO2F4 TaxID=2607790 RepID=UPI00142A1EAB|nr:hypothetical protein [Okeania sp. SIO2F4]NES06713.1 hypothetical protein [Okeania sp. SIO2F4]
MRKILYKAVASMLLATLLIWNMSVGVAFADDNDPYTCDVKNELPCRIVLMTNENNKETLTIKNTSQDNKNINVYLGNTSLISSVEVDASEGISGICQDIENTLSSLESTDPQSPCELETTTNYHQTITANKTNQVQGVGLEVLVISRNTAPK